MAARAQTVDALILDLWESGAGASPLDRALMLLASGRPELSEAERLDLALGARDRAIASFRAELFGAGVELTARCPHCAGEVEFALPDAAALFPASSPTCEMLGSGRPATSADLKAAAAAAVQGRDPRTALAERLGLDPGLPAEAIDHALEALDPAAELRLGLACPDCGGEWAATFDVVDCAWREIEAEGARLADEVAALARAYGWREADTLAMSRARRRLYLERAGA